ncbi:MAG: transglycosylase SLT domain-containing protein [Rhodobiaceae bacterium]|nr:transglycosylase SLT domain-containing protein [Rhodobiaceae bacterium]MCC0054120.1 transglycosylase SLT domain-containing protein [Rhodobiaceae bacterium]
MKVAVQQTMKDRVMSALANASARTGIDFDYLVKTAARESAFNPDAKAPTSSATGLFQFIDSTWLGVIRENGTRFGLDEEAAAIEPAGRGRFRVEDPQMRSHILALRNDPEVSALMAGAFTEDNADYLRQAIGRDASEGELYIAHFLGAGGAAQMIRLAESDPGARAADHFPAAAKANKPIFYKRGVARSVGDVYQKLVAKHEHMATPVTRAEAGASSPRVFSVPGSTANVPALSASTPVRGDGGAFRGLFTSGAPRALGPGAQGGLDALSLFTTPGGQVTGFAPVQPPAGGEAFSAIDAPAAGTAPVSERRVRLRGAGDAAAIERARHVPVPPSHTASVAPGAGTAGEARGLGRFIKGIASLFGLAGRQG